MPFDSVEETGNFIGVPRAEPEDEPDVAFSDALGAAFRSENIVGSTLSSSALNFWGTPFDEDLDPFAEIAGTKYEAFAENFSGARNLDHVEAIKADVDREMVDRETIANAGAVGIAASMAAGFFDLPTLLPAGAAINTSRAGFNVLRVAGATAAAGALESSVSEAALQATQQTRTGVESALNIGGSVVLSGLLGAGIGSLMSRAQVDELAPRIERDFNIPADGEPDPFIPGSVRAPVGAAVTDRPEDILKDAFGLERVLKFQDPTLRLLNSTSDVTRRWSQELHESVLMFTKNAEGLETAPLGSQMGSPGSVEGRIRLWEFPLAKSLTFMDDQFLRYRKGRGKRFPGEVGLTQISDAARGTRGALDHVAFKREVFRALNRNDQHDIPEVAATAKLLRKEIFDPFKDKAIALNFLDEDVSVGDTALSYVTRIYNREKIVAERPAFKERVLAHLQSDDDFNRQIRERVSAQLRELDEIDAEIKPLEAGSRLDELNGRREELVRTIEGEVINFRGKRANAARAAVRRVDEQAGGRDPSAPRLRGADRDVLKAARRIARDVDTEPGELDSLADEIIGRILGTPDGRLPYDANTNLNRRGEGAASRQDLAGPLKQRVFNIPNEMIEDFLEDDIEHILRVYVRSMAPDVELAERFGDVRMTTVLKEIEEDYAKRSARAKTPKERKKLDNQRKADIRDMAAIRDRLRGTFAIPDNPEGILSRGGAVVRSLNFLSLLGSMTVSAFADPAKFVMRHGLTRTFRDGLIPLARNWSGARLAQQEIEASGTALDLILDSRAMNIGEVTDDWGRGSKFERGLQAATRNFGLVSLMSPWNAEMKKFGGLMTMNRILRAAENTKSGKAAGKEIELLAEGGISQTNARIIAEQFGKHGSKEGGVWHANTADWDEGTQAAVEAFRVALARDIDRTIVTPGQDKPLFMSKEMGRLVLQFKSFAIASTQRTLLIGLQQRDAAVLNGMMLAAGLGMLVHIIKEKQAGREIDIDFEDPEELSQLLVNGIDRSGLTGWLMDANSMTEKATRGTVGLSAFTGKPISRYASRNLTGSFFGPTFGTAESAFRVTGAVVGGDDLKRSDISAMRRLLPYQNLFYLRNNIFDKAEQAIAEGLGAE